MLLKIIGYMEHTVCSPEKHAHCRYSPPLEVDWDCAQLDLGQVNVHLVCMCSSIQLNAHQMSSVDGLKHHINITKNKSSMPQPRFTI